MRLDDIKLARRLMIADAGIHQSGIATLHQNLATAQMAALRSVRRLLLYSIPE